MTAESAYLFRHALLRDAAYQLQLPGDRATLHGLAFAVIEELAGGPPPATPLRALHVAFRPHPTDAFAEELALHAGLSRSPAGPGAFEAARTLYLRRAAESHEANFRLDAARTAWLQLAELSSGSGRGEALRRAGIAAWRGGKSGAVKDLLEQALALFRAAGDRWSEGIATGNLASLLRDLGQVEPAERLFEQALAIHVEAGNRRSEGMTCGNLANLYLETGRLDEAERFLQKSLSIHRETGSRGDEGTVLGNLAGLCLETGRLAEAERNYDEALSIQRATQQRRQVGITLGNLGQLYLETGRFAEAGRAIGESLALHREVGDLCNQAVAIGNLATIQARTGHRDLAERGFLAALAMHQEHRNRRFEGIHLCDFACFLVAGGRIDEARRAWAKGAGILREFGNGPELDRLGEQMRGACAEAGIEAIGEERL
ncbi:MAG: tetratricopeptide repeat protein [Planctomycetes bacterium]|nr:tetratricopeptide repeat protein [Planctomycetota bacterium]